MKIFPTSIKIKYVTQIFQQKSLVVGNYLLLQLYMQIAEVNLLCKPTSSYRVIYYPKVISHYLKLTTNHFSHIDNKNYKDYQYSPYNSMVKTHNKLLKLSLWGKPNKASPVQWSHMRFQSSRISACIMASDNCFAWLLELLGRC